MITTPNSFIASTAAIVHLGAIPVFVDVLNDQNIDPLKIEKVITKKTKAIMPVHLCGKMSQMDKIMKIAKKYNLKVVEDAAQSVASKYKNQAAGSIGHVGCFSAHPLKNLGGMGDGGYITTNDFKIFKKIKSLSNHGMENRNIIKNFGYVSRMDNLQAAFLNYNLRFLKSVIMKRRINANIYLNYLNKKFLKLPYEGVNEFHTYHTFVIQVKNKRNELKSYLEENGVETSIHYPIPIHLQPASKKFGYKKGSFPIAEKQSRNILTLPINQYLKKKEIIYISNLINNFYGS